MKKQLILLAPLVLSGCMGGIEKPQAPSSNFDGLWLGMISNHKQYQQVGTTEFTCGTGTKNAFFFIDEGRIGMLDVGPSLGRVDANGTLLAKVPMGEFNTYGAPNNRAEFVLNGRLQGKAGDGISIYAIKGTDRGCRGEVKFHRINPNDFVDRRTATTRMGEFIYGGITFASAAFTSGSIKSRDSRTFTLRGDGVSCYGWRRKDRKDSLSGIWYAYCGNNRTVKGRWQLQGSSLTASGADNSGKEVSIRVP